jgi:hypothetical protein
MTLSDKLSLQLKAVRSKVSQILPHLRSVSVEPAALLLLASMLMNYMLYQDLILERVCQINLKHMNNTEEVCKESVKK